MLNKNPNNNPNNSKIVIGVTANGKKKVKLTAKAYYLGIVHKINEKLR